jgi:hypothetical protein
MHLRTPLGVWGSVGLRMCIYGGRSVYILIPTKTSQFWNQLSGGVPLQLIDSFFMLWLVS